MSINTSKNKARLTAFVTLAILLISSTGWAATYFVDKSHPSASNSNAGTESKPFLTVQQGINKAFPGDIVYVRGGTYYETVNLVRSGSAGKPITIKKYPNATAVLNGSKSSDYRVVDWAGKKNYIIWDGIDVMNGARYGVWCEGNYNQILNSRIGNHGSKGQVATGLTTIETDHVIIRNNEVFNNGWNGISVSSSTNATVEYNIAYDNTSHNGIQLMCSPALEQKLLDNNNMRYNISYNNEAGVYLRYQRNNEVRDNLIFDNHLNGIFIHNGTSYLSTWQANTKILNNTIAHNGANGINNSVVTHLTVKNNIFANNTKKDFTTSKTKGHIIDNNLYYSSVQIGWGGSSYSSPSSFRSATGHEANGITADPLFKDPANKDYSIKSGSPAIDAGADLSNEGPAKDLEGTPRPQQAGFDIGAYEYGAGVMVISAPKNVKIQTL